MGDVTVPPRWQDEEAWAVVAPWINRLAEERPMVLPTLESVKAALEGVVAAREGLRG